MLSKLWRKNSSGLRFSAKVGWWNDRTWLDEYQRHIEPDARPTQGIDFKRILDRRFTLKEFARAARRLRGSTAECGVYTGVSSAIICQALGDTYQGDEHHYGFDSFEGLPETAVNDGRWKKGDLAAPIDIARKHLAEFPCCELIAGWIPASLTAAAEQRFRFVHMDLDLHDPTRDALQFFYPRLWPGAIVLFDDYGFLSCPGAREAVDRFLSDKPEPLIELTTGQAVFTKL